MTREWHDFGFIRDAAAIAAEPRVPRWRGCYGYATCSCGWRSALTTEDAQRRLLHRQHFDESPRERLVTLAASDDDWEWGTRDENGRVGVAGLPNEADARAWARDFPEETVVRRRPAGQWEVAP